MKKNQLILFLIALCCFNPLIAQPNNAIRTIWHPMYLDKRLAYCDDEVCGKPIANHYCQLLGYDHAKRYVKAYNVGYTHYLTSRVRCVGWRCNGFLLIDCAKSLVHKPPKPYHYRQRKFAYPRYNNYRVDWCYNQHSGCGARAANSFCERLGYLKAKSFAKEHCFSATQSIGSQELCFGPKCNAFRNIICYR